MTKQQVCKRCRRLKSDQPRTTMCAGTRANHVWADVAGRLGQRMLEKKKLARLEAAHFSGPSPAIDEDGEPR